MRRHEVLHVCSQCLVPLTLELNYGNIKALLRLYSGYSTGPAAGRVLGIRDQHTSAYVSIEARQHTSAYVSIEALLRNSRLPIKAPLRLY